MPYGKKEWRMFIQGIRMRVNCQCLRDNLISKMYVKDPHPTQVYMLHLAAHNM